MKQTTTHSHQTNSVYFPNNFSFILCLVMTCILHRTLEKLSDKWWIKCSVLGKSFKFWIGVSRDVIFDKAWGVLCGSVAVEPKFILISIRQSILEVIRSNYSKVGLVLDGSVAICGWINIFETGWKIWNKKSKWKVKQFENNHFCILLGLTFLNVSKNLFVAMKVHSPLHRTKSAVKASGQTHLLLAETLRKSWTNDWRHSKRQTTFGTNWKLCLKVYRCFGY